MRKRFWPVLLSAIALGAAVTATATFAAAPAQTPSSAEKKESPPALPGMVTYYFGMLVKGPKWTPADTPELKQLQEAHLAHIRGMGATGKLVVAGPLADDGFIRGLLIFKTATLEEAKSMAEEDPAVKAGRLVLEIHPWLVEKGVLP